MSRTRKTTEPADLPTGDTRVDEIVAAFAASPGVTHTRMMASLGLRVDGGFFALFRDGELVVRLPAARVAALLAAGTGRPFRRGEAGPPMREWIVIPRSHRRWLPLAQEAHAARSQPSSPPAKTTRNTARKRVRSKT